MAPSIKPGTKITVDKKYYSSKEPKRGDIVAVTRENATVIIRIVGLPGEIISLIQGKVYINDRPLNEEYIQKSSADDLKPLTLSTGEFFVLSDNRASATDSRILGPIKKSEIIGKVE